MNLLGKIRYRILYILSLAMASVVVAGEPEPVPGLASTIKPISPKKVFDYRQPIIFQDNFSSAQFTKWQFSINFSNFSCDQPQAQPKQVQIVGAPGLGAGRFAVLFEVLRAPDSFRSELCLPAEDGFQERWYGERIMVPCEWVFDPNPAASIVMQWHALRGNWHPTFPNLAICIGNTNWIIRQSFGPAQQPTRTSKIISEPLARGVWVSWVIHAKWSPAADGLLQIWKDGKLVWESQGLNVYSTIGLAYTPYLKTGIYHPNWRMDQKTSRQKEDFFKEITTATNKLIYITDVKIGTERACYADVAPGKPASKP